MKQRNLITLLEIFCIGILISGCGNAGTEKNEDVQLETLTETEDVQEEALSGKDNIFYQKQGNSVIKYSVKSGIVSQEQLSDNEIQEQQLEDLTTGRILVWQDSFNGNELDTDVWECAEGHKKDDELQYYTADGNNLVLDDGILRITAKNDNKYPGFNWTSASIRTLGKKQFLKGRLEAKVKFTNTTGQLGRFWTVGAWAGVKWPICGEINIGEQYGNSASDYYKLTSSIHYAASDGSHKYEAGEAHSYNNQLNDQEYHILAAEWTDDEIKIFVDDDNYVTYDIRDKYYYRPVEKSGAEINPFMLPHYLQMNLAVQSSDQVDNTKPMVMEVDWVRVYAAEDVEQIESLVPSKLGIDYVYNVADASKILISDMEYRGKVGDKIYLGAVYLPNTVVDRSCIFSVDDTSIAEIDQSGALIVKGEGKVVITVTDVNSGVTASRGINLYTY